MITAQFPHPIAPNEFFQHLLEAVAHGARLEFPLYEATPTVSVWPMRPKWERYGQYWGYIHLPESRKDRADSSEPKQCPPIQLAYARVGNEVIQAAHWSNLKITH